MKDNRISNAFLILGALFVASALVLLIHNEQRAHQAQEASRQVFAQLQGALCQRFDGMSHEDTGDIKTEESSGRMDTTEVDGLAYIGILTIPVLDLQLPILAELEKEEMKTAPCRQFGAIQTDDLVIAGHNYDCHFGSLHHLKPDDRIQFTDVHENTYAYTVQTVGIIQPTAVDEVKNSVWDLVLYTCTYGGGNRVMVGCRRMADGEGMRNGSDKMTLIGSEP